MQIDIFNFYEYNCNNKFKKTNYIITNNIIQNAFGKNMF